MNKKYYLKFWFHFPKKSLVTSRYTTIYDISISNSLVFLDIDDTLCGDKDIVSQKSISWLTKLKKNRNKVILLSNCGKNREDELRDRLKLCTDKIITKSDKPNPKMFKESIKRYPAFRNTYMIGDRVATDLYGAYLGGIMNRILVKPYSTVFKSPKASYIYRFSRYLENWFSMYT